MNEYFDILDKYFFPKWSIYYKCETPEQLLIDIEILSVICKNGGVSGGSIDYYHFTLDDTISEIKMLIRTERINKVLNNG